MLEQLVERTGTEKLKDLMATLNLLTARSMAQGIQRFIGEVDELIVGGGGARNKVLMDNLKREMGGVPVLTLGDIGVDGDHKEALAFAMLGNETLHGRPGNVPRATGASMPAVLGKNGVERIVELKLTDEEKAAFGVSVGHVEKAVHEMRELLAI